MLNTERLCMGCMNDNGGEKICRICGYDSTASNAPEYLNVKSWIKSRYLVGKVLEFNGEGVTYIGWDNEENNIVNIREYFPVPAAHREPDKTVSIVGGSEYVFNEGIMDFLELYKKLMTVELPAVMPVTEVFEDNGTAYAISKTVTGITLREFLLRNGGTLKWEQARPLFIPFISAICELHKLGIIHGGISPETVLVGRDGKLHLTDFCIPEICVSQSALNSQLFPGFAALEQYNGSVESLCEATDVYGLSATLFKTLMGNVPPEATERLIDDRISISQKIADELPASVLTALANGLQIQRENRTVSMADFKEEITAGIEQTTVIPVQGKSVQSGEAKPQKKAVKKVNNNAKYVVISSAITAGILLVIGIIIVLLFFRESVFPKKIQTEDTSSIFQSESSSQSEQTSVVSTEKLYAVPSFTGVSYASIVSDSQYEMFEFEVTYKKYSNAQPKGTVIEQDVSEGTTVKKGTKIKFVLSLGAENMSLPDLSGKTKDEALIALLRQGFDYDNISFVDKYDETKKPGVVIETDPAYKTTVTPDSSITVFINSYEGTVGVDIMP